MNPLITELQDKGHRALEAAKSILSQYKGQNVPKDQEEALDRALKDADECDKRIQQLGAIDEKEARFAKAEEVRRLAPVGQIGDSSKELPKDVQRKALNAGIRGRSIEGLGDVEKKYLSSQTDPEGHVFVNDEIRMEIIQKLANVCHIRKVARVITTNAASVRTPTANLGITSLNKTKESGTVTKRNLRNVFGKQSLTPKKFSDIITVPDELVDDADFDIIGFIADQYAMQIAPVDEEARFVAGTGVEEPLGITSATLTAKDLATASSDAYTADDILGIPYELKAQYRGPNCCWLLSRAKVAACRKLRASVYNGSTLVDSGPLLWSPSLIPGEPATLNGYKILETEYMPTASADGHCVGIFGDFSYYWIVDRKAITIRRLNELYAESGEVGFRFDKRFDGAPVLSEAFVRINRN